MCIRVLRDALVLQVDCRIASGGRALLQARGLWLEQDRGFDHLPLLKD